MTDRIECAVIGAGVVGLAATRALAQNGLEVIVLEAEHAIGTGISSRNSEVIHAGLYYPPGSLKARLCVQGKKDLYAYCERNNVEHRRCGKLLVATEQALHADLENAGGVVAFASAVMSAELMSDGIMLRTADGTELLADRMVNAAGLFVPAPDRLIIHTLHSV